MAHKEEEDNILNHIPIVHKFKFDHNEDTWFDSIGMTKDDIEMWLAKFHSIPHQLSKDEYSKSEVTELVCELMSVEELVLTTVSFFMDKSARLRAVDPNISEEKPRGTNIGDLLLEFLETAHKRAQADNNNIIPKPYIKKEP